MAYNTEKLKEEIMSTSKEMKFFFLADVFAWFGIGTSTFYEHFPKESKDYADIYGILKKNRAEVKVGLRNKWYNGTNAQAQITLYKIIATQDEIDRIKDKSRAEEEFDNTNKDSDEGSEFILPNGTKINI